MTEGMLKYRSPWLAVPRRLHPRHLDSHIVDSMRYAFEAMWRGRRIFVDSRAWTGRP